jgi:hypothetical protein
MGENFVSDRGSAVRLKERLIVGHNVSGGDGMADIDFKRRPRVTCGPCSLRKIEISLGPRACRSMAMLAEHDQREAGRGDGAHVGRHSPR